jgi:hypothetical protein
MFETVSNSGNITIGRIAFLVLGAIPIAISIRVFTFPSSTKGERLEGMMLVFLTMVTSLLFGVFGTIVVVWKARRRESFLFYLLWTTIVALPGLYFGLMFLCIVILEKMR